MKKIAIGIECGRGLSLITYRPRGKGDQLGGIVGHKWHLLADHWSLYLIRFDLIRLYSVSSGTCTYSITFQYIKFIVLYFHN